MQTYPSYDSFEPHPRTKIKLIAEKKDGTISHLRDTLLWDSQTYDQKPDLSLEDSRKWILLNILDNPAATRPIWIKVDKQGLCQALRIEESLIDKTINNDLMRPLLKASFKTSEHFRSLVLDLFHNLKVFCEAQPSLAFLSDYELPFDKFFKKIKEEFSTLDDILNTLKDKHSYDKDHEKLSKLQETSHHFLDNLNKKYHSLKKHESVLRKKRIENEWKKTYQKQKKRLLNCIEDCKHSLFLNLDPLPNVSAPSNEDVTKNLPKLNQTSLIKV